MSMRVIVCWFILIIPCIVQAQISMEDFLLASLEEPEIKSFSQQENYLKSKPFRLAPIRQLEFRTESNQLDPERQDYALRINPSNPWEVKRNKEYFQSYQELLQLDRNRLLRESLRTRYEVIIGWVYYQEISVLKGEDKQTTEKLLSILEGQRFSTYFDADDYVELKLEQVDRALEVEETKFEIDNQRRRVEGLYENAKLNTLEWPYTAVISLEKLVVVVDSLMQQQTAGGEVSYREKQIDLANREWLLEKNNINLGFLQAQYEEFRTEQGRSPWSVSLGVTIPVFNPNKGDMTKRKLDVLEAQGDLDEAKVEQNSGRELAYRKIKSLMQRHHDITTMMQELNVGTLSTTLQQINDSNPTAIIRLQRNLIKLKTMATRLKQEIYLSYVEFLYYAEVLQQQPLLNYLSPHLTTLTTP